MSEDTSVYIEALQVPSGTRTPGDIQSLIGLVAQYLQIRGVENYSQIQVNTLPPTADGQDSIWLETDGTGQPQALKVYDGSSWRVLEFRVPSGSTDERPVNPKEGEKYYDVTISQELIYVSGMWRTSWGGKGQHIFVLAASPEEALRLYPGWAMATKAEGLFIRGANLAIGPGKTGGSTTTRLKVDNIPPHHHEAGPAPDTHAPIKYPFGVGETASTQFESRPNQPATAVGRTSTTGTGLDFDITNPYYTLWVLKRID